MIIIDNIRFKGIYSLVCLNVPDGKQPEFQKMIKEMEKSYNSEVQFVLNDSQYEKDFPMLVDDERFLTAVFLIDRFGRIRKIFTDEYKSYDVFRDFEKIILQDLSLSLDIDFRRAKRGLSEKSVSDEEIETMLSAAHIAPSCSNKQPWNFHVIKNKDLLEKVHETLTEGNYWMKKAPVLIVVYSDRDSDCKLSDNRDYYLFDTGLAVGMLMTQATHMGIIAHPIAGYDPVKIKSLLNMSIDKVVITIIAVGYQGDTSHLNEKHCAIEISERERKPLEEIMKWD